LAAVYSRIEDRLMDQKRKKMLSGVQKASIRVYL
jgi:hypothetical protein